LSFQSLQILSRGTELFVDAWSGEGCRQTLQWQILENGTWKDIKGATKENFEYMGLQPGEYTIRCIVKNAIGEMSSVPISFTVA